MNERMKQRAIAFANVISYRVISETKRFEISLVKLQTDYTPLLLSVANQRSTVIAQMMRIRIQI